MDATYWIKQSSTELAFPEIEWNKPENKRLAKEMVIIGGSAQGFTQVAKSYTYVQNAGIGSLRVIIPESAVKVLGSAAPIALEPAPSNTSGGFSRKALPTFLAFSSHADGALLAGDFGRNSETAITIHDFLKKYSGPVTATKDTINYFISDPHTIQERQDTILVCNFSQLQKLAKSLSFTKAFLFEDSLSKIVETLHELTQTHAFSVVTLHHSNIIVAHSGMVSTTHIESLNPESLWQLELSAWASVYYIQHAGQEFEALTTAVQVFVNA